jgi:hypothetical protein
MLLLRLSERSPDLGTGSLFLQHYTSDYISKDLHSSISTFWLDSKLCSRPGLLSVCQGLLFGMDCIYVTRKRTQCVAIFNEMVYASMRLRYAQPYSIDACALNKARFQNKLLVGYQSLRKDIWEH